MTLRIARIISLIVPAFQLPKMNGIELTLRLKQNPKTSSIRVVIYADDFAGKDAAIKAGAAMVVKKTKSMRQIKQAIQSALAGHP